MRIGIVLPNWIGDVAMATPTLRALHREFSGRAKRIGIIRPYAAQVLEGLPWLDEWVLFDHRSDDPALRTWRVINQLRRMRIDTMVLLTNSPRSALIARLAGARQRVGYARYGRGPLLTHKIPWRRPQRRTGSTDTGPMSTVDYYLQLAYLLGCPPESPRLQLATTPADRHAAEGFWNSRGLQKAARVVALHTGGAYGQAKHWPPAHGAELARRLVDTLDCAVLVLCGPGERESALALEQQVGHPAVVSLAREQLSIGLTKACLERSDLLVTTDSGPRHLAAGLGVPVIALFGPTDPRLSWNYHPREKIVRLALDCMPCAQRTCPLRHHRCMQDLTVDRVLSAVQQGLCGEWDKEAA